jgi:hypothetical protein
LTVNVRFLAGPSFSLTSTLTRNDFGVPVDW